MPVTTVLSHPKHNPVSSTRYTVLNNPTIVVKPVVIVEDRTHITECALLEEKRVKLNHFACVCRSSHTSYQPSVYAHTTEHNPVHHVKDDAPAYMQHHEVNQSTEAQNAATYQYVYTCNPKPQQGCPFTSIHMFGTDVRVMIDTGASLNILSIYAYESLVSPPMLEQTNS